MTDFFEITPTDEVTLHGLENWVTKMFEKLGWMTLAASHNNAEKVLAYINSCNKLKESIIKRQQKFKEGDDRLEDLKVLQSKMEHLCTICDKLFNKQAIQNKICSKCPSENKNNSDNNIPVLKGGKKSSKKQSKKSSKKQSKKQSKKSSKKLSKKQPKINPKNIIITVKKISSKKNSKK
jgi:hypothetical protein